jgi:uncharacterized protein YecT (DUF1311 family)
MGRIMIAVSCTNAVELITSLVKHIYRAPVLSMVLAIVPFATLSAAATNNSLPNSAVEKCEAEAQTQSEINDCAAKDARAADERLNRAYRNMMGNVDAEDKAKLVAAQRAWIAFRDADCAFWSSGGGSIAPWSYSSCIADHSRARAKELDGWPSYTGRDGFTPCK